jgi:hypothetical protein
MCAAQTSHEEDLAIQRATNIDYQLQTIPRQLRQAKHVR